MEDSKGNIESAKLIVVLGLSLDPFSRTRAPDSDAFLVSYTMEELVAAGVDGVTLDLTQPNDVLAQFDALPTYDGYDPSPRVLGLVYGNDAVAWITLNEYKINVTASSLLPPPDCALTYAPKLYLPSSLTGAPALVIEAYDAAEQAVEKVEASSEVPLDLKHTYVALRGLLGLAETFAHDMSIQPDSLVEYASARRISDKMKVKYRL